MKQLAGWVLLLVCTAVATGEDATKSFDALFGAEARKAATADAKAKAAFAKKLLDASATLSGDKALQELLWTKTVDFGSGHADGYPAALEAITRLANARPTERDAWEERAVALL